MTRDALAAGDVLVDQARVIVNAVEELPDDLDQDLVAQAEAHLVAEAAHHDARTLKILGRRLLEVVAPEVADAHEAKLLEKEERDAAQACRLTMTDDGHGKTYGRFTLPTAQAAMLAKILHGFAAPEAPVPPPKVRASSVDRVRSGWVARSASSSSATPPTGSPTPAASTPPRS